jgi:hypothetical protein
MRSIKRAARCGYFNRLQEARAPIGLNSSASIQGEEGVRLQQKNVPGVDGLTRDFGWNITSPGEAFHESRIPIRHTTTAPILPVCHLSTRYVIERSPAFFMKKAKAIDLFAGTRPGTCNRVRRTVRRSMESPWATRRRCWLSGGRVRPRPGVRPHRAVPRRAVLRRGPAQQTGSRDGRVCVRA